MGDEKYSFVIYRLFWRALIKGKISFRKVLNVGWATLAYTLRLRKSAPAPFILSLELWNECNAGCLFCRDAKGVIHDMNPDGGRGNIAKGKMSLEMAKDILGQFKDDIIIAVLYTNGEPLLYKDLAKLVQFATENKIATMIATNGLLFDETNAKDLLEAGIDFIKIQLSGYTQDIYSVQIRYGNVEKLKENIRLVADLNKKGNYGSLILVDYISYNYNRHQLPLVQTFCREIDVLMSVRPGNPQFGLEDKEPPLSLEPLPLKISCDWLWKAMQINWNGDVVQCCEGVVWSGAPIYSKYEIGKTNLREIWNGEKAVATRNLMTMRGRGAISMCTKCRRKGVAFKW